MKKLLIGIVVVAFFASSSAFALQGKELVDCGIQVSKALDEDNKKCHEKYGQDGAKDRKGFNKCKYLAKDKYEEGNKKCKERTK